MDAQLLRLEGKEYVLVKRSEYERLRALARAASVGEGLLALPAPLADGNFPAVEYARASLARKIIIQREALGLGQAELARRAGIRPETLNRIEKGNMTPGVATVEKLSRALQSAELECGKKTSRSARKAPAKRKRKR